MSSDETISIMGEEVPAKRDLIEIDQLEFLPDNPRVYAVIRDMDDFNDLTVEEQQNRIYKQMLQEQSVKKLRPQIKRDGGLQEPIIVRWDTKRVIEGNSRLAVYRNLSEDSEGERWTRIKCLVVSSLTDDQQTRLLGQAHLHGRTEWSRYAKALFCFRWVEEEQKDMATLSTISGISRAEISKNVKVIQLMKENDDSKPSHFSYYNVLVRTRSISSATEDNASLRDILLAQIKDEAFTAQEMRERMPVVIAKPKILRKYVNKSVKLDDAYDLAKVSGAQQRLRKIRENLDEIEKNDVARLERGEIKALQQVVRQIGQRLKRVSNMIDAELAEKSPSKI